jgi:hypothetical protein
LPLDDVQIGTRLHPVPTSVVECQMQVRHSRHYLLAP